MIRAIQILVLIQILACKEAPTYNPFDNQFNVSVRKLIQDNCDTVPVSCQYYNLIMNFGRLKPFYQIYEPEFYTVVGKGFIYEMDTFLIKGFKDIYTDEARIDSIINLPFDMEEMSNELKKFNYSIIDRKFDTITIVNFEQKDSVILKLAAFPIHRNRTIVRGIEYFVTENKTIR